MRFPIYVFAMLFIVFASACISSPQQNNGLVVTLQADPPSIFQKKDLDIHIDLDNTDTKRIFNVRAEIFNPGILLPYGECSDRYDVLLPGQFETFSCKFQAPEINQDRFTTEIDAKATFEVPFSLVQTIETITEEEYRNRQATGNIRTKPNIYRYRDRNIEVQLEFSDPLPIIVTRGKEMFLKITVKNIGNGFVEALEQNDIIIKQTLDEAGNGIIDTSCIPEKLLPLGKEFPTFSCRINPFLITKPMQSFDIEIEINYRYEVRDKLKIDIMR